MIVTVCDSCHVHIPQGADINIHIMMESNSLGVAKKIHLCGKCWRITIKALTNQAGEDTSEFDVLEQLCKEQEKAKSEASS